MFGFLGIGAAGNNITDLAVQNGFEGIVINSSQRDLDCLVNVENKLKIIGSEGVGKKRDVALQLMTNNHEQIEEFVLKHFSKPSIEIIVVTFSTGGGTGSGISPLLVELLMDVLPDKTIIALPILPDESEVLVNQFNSLKAFEELSELDIAVFSIDNNKIKKNNPNFGKNKLYKFTNEKVIDLFKKITSYTDKHSSHGVLDRNDLMTIMKTKGIGLISEVDIVNLSDGMVNLSKEGVSSAIEMSWNNSIFAPIEYNKVMSAGIIFDGQESLMEYIDYRKIFSIFDNGEPMYLFEGNFHEEQGKVISILSGLDWCKSRLMQIEGLVNEKQMNIQESMIQSQETFKTKVDLSGLTQQLNQKPQKKRSRMELLNKYRR